MRSMHALAFYSAAGNAIEESEPGSFDGGCPHITTSLTFVDSYGLTRNQHETLSINNSDTGNLH